MAPADLGFYRPTLATIMCAEHSAVTGPLGEQSVSHTFQKIFQVDY